MAVTAKARSQAALHVTTGVESDVVRAVSCVGLPVPMRPLRSRRRSLARLSPLVALAVIGPAISGASATPAPRRSASIAATLHSPRYLQKHCPIEVAVNFGSGHRIGSGGGVSVGSSKTHVTVNGKPNQYAVRYHWRLSTHDQFCGIVGGWYGPEFRSLKPTTESAHGGIYIDTSVEDPSNSLAEFIVYARRASH